MKIWAGVAGIATFRDTGVPVISSTLPADNATGVSDGISPTITFNEAVTFGTGLITLRQNIASVWSDLETFDVATEVGTGNGQVSISGYTLTINPTASLTGSREYAIRIASTAIKDTYGNSFAGVADDTTISFTTAASTITRVGLSALVGVDNAPDLPLDIPAGSNGEYLVIFMTSKDGNRVPTTPVDWLKIGTGAGWSTGEPAISVFGKFRDGTEGSTITINTPDGWAEMIGFIGAYSGVSGAGVESTVAAFGATTRATPTLTANANSCILHIWTLYAPANVVTLPNGSDLVRAGTTPNGDWFLGAENQLTVSAGTTTGRTASSTVSGNWNAMQIELLKA